MPCFLTRKHVRSHDKKDTGILPATHVSGMPCFLNYNIQKIVATTTRFKLCCCSLEKRRFSWKKLLGVVILGFFDLIFPEPEKSVRKSTAVEHGICKLQRQALMFSWLMRQKDKCVALLVPGACRTNGLKADRQLLPSAAATTRL